MADDNNIVSKIIDGQQPDGRYCRWFTLGATEVDLNNRLRLQALLGMFQETAGDQCEQYGSGWSTLWTDHGLCYVVVRMEVRMEKYPGTGARVRIDTWPDPKLRLIFSRYGEIYGEDGERLGAIVSQWALLDVNARTFVRPDPAIIVLPDTSTLTAPFELRPGHRGGDDCPCPFSLERAPVYSDFDYNGHMNNARYAEWTADTLWQVLTPEARAQKPAIRRLLIQFRTEIPAEAVGRGIALEGGVWPEEGRFTLAGSNGKTVFFDSEAEFEKAYNVTTYREVHLKPGEALKIPVFWHRKEPLPEGTYELSVEFESSDSVRFELLSKDEAPGCELCFVATALKSGQATVRLYGSYDPDKLSKEVAESLYFEGKSAGNLLIDAVVTIYVD